MRESRTCLPSLKRGGGTPRKATTCPIGVVEARDVLSVVVSGQYRDGVREVRLASRPFKEKQKTRGSHPASSARGCGAEAVPRTTHPRRRARLNLRTWPVGLQEGCWPFKPDGRGSNPLRATGFRDGTLYNSIVATEVELAYIAGLFDGEGSVFRTSVKSSKNQKRYPRLTAQIAQNDRRVLDWIRETLGYGAVYEKGLSVAGNMGHNFRTTHRTARMFLIEIQPYLRVKAELVGTLLEDNSTEIPQVVSAGTHGGL